MSSITELQRDSLARHLRKHLVGQVRFDSDFAPALQHGCQHLSDGTAGRRHCRLGKPNALFETRSIEELLRQHFKQADSYRYNSAAIRVRGIDPAVRDDAAQEAGMQWSSLTLICSVLRRAVVAAATESL